MTIGKLSGQCDFGQKGQSYCNQRGQSCVAKRVKVAWLFHPNANKRWTRGADQFLLKLHDEGKSVKYIAAKMGRSQTSIVMRLNKLTQ